MPRLSAVAMVRRMLRLGRAAAIVLLVSSLVVAGCSLDPRADATKAAARFLDAVRTGDRKAFEAAIDRSALRADLRDQLAELGRARGLDVEGGASEFALDRRITPEAFHVVLAGTGSPLASAPTAQQVATVLKVKDRAHACLTAPGGGVCVLGFTRHAGEWKLTAMPAHEVKIELAPAPARR